MKILNDLVKKLGKEVIYEITANKKITDTAEQITAFLNTVLRIPADKLTVTVDGEKAVVEVPMQLPEQFTSAMMEKLIELTSVTDVMFKVKENK